MKKLHSFIACTLVACLTLVLFSSCDKDEKNAESGFAPKSIVGKTLHISGLGWSPIYLETSSTCIWYWDVTGNKEGTYSYKKKGDNIAQFQCWMEDGTSSVLITLRFVNSEEGYLPGGEYFILY